MLFDDVYPPDIPAFEASKTQGIPMEENSFHATMKALADSGVEVGRLRILPDVGEYGRSEQHLQLLGAWAQRATILGGEDVRVVRRSAVEAGLRAACGRFSPTLRRYERGIRTREPQASFWSVRRPQPAMGSLELTAVRLMHYRGQELSDDLLYDKHIPRHLRRFEQFWHNVFYNIAAPPAQPAS